MTKHCHASGVLKETRQAAADSFVSCRQQHHLVRILNLYYSPPSAHQNATTANLLLFLCPCEFLPSFGFDQPEHFCRIQICEYKSNAVLLSEIILLPFRAAILMTAPCLRRDRPHT